MKTLYMSGANAILPREWLDAVEAPSHVRQGEMLVTALKKADVPALLTDRGLSQRVADNMAKHTKTWTRYLPTPWQMLVDDDIIDLADVGVYAAYNTVKNSTVVRIDLDGVARPIARFDYDSARGGLVAERI